MEEFLRAQLASLQIATGLECSFNGYDIRFPDGVRFGVRLLRSRIRIDYRVAFNRRQGRQLVEYLLTNLPRKMQQIREAREEARRRVPLEAIAASLSEIGVSAQYSAGKVNIQTRDKEFLAMCLLYTQVRTSSSFNDEHAILRAVLSDSMPLEAYCDWLEENGHDNSKLRALLS